jgi:hypothetical protein
VAIDRSVVSVERLAEDPVADLLAAPNPAGLLRQGGQHIQLCAGERHLGPGARNVAGVHVDRQVEEGRGWPRRRAVDRVAGPLRGRPAETSQDRPDPGDHLARLEWLGDIVVGAQLQPGDTVDDVVAGGQHQHSDTGPLAPKGSQDFEAGPSRQHYVQDQKVQAAVAAVLEGSLAILGFEDFVALAFEVRADHFSNVRLVVGDEDSRSHRHTIAEWSA